MTKGLTLPSNYTTIQLNTVGSTNQFLKDYVSEQQSVNPIVCITQKQTAGYGQQKRSWQTNHESAIFSIAYPLSSQDKMTGLVSLHIARLIHQCLIELTGDTLFLKWPNDIYNQQGKVAGILIEQVIKKEYRCLIIGVGINRNHTNLIDSASSVSDFKTEELIKSFFEKINLPGLVKFSIVELLDYWKTHDLFSINEAIQLITAEDIHSAQAGFYQGITPQGEALIKLNQKIQSLTSGQTSIRKQS